MTDKAREALKALRNATYRLACDTSYEELVSKMFDGIDTLDRELRRCRAQTLREAMTVLKESVKPSPLPLATSEPYRTGFNFAKWAALSDLTRMADEEEK